MLIFTNHHMANKIAEKNLKGEFNEKKHQIKLRG